MSFLENLGRFVRGLRRAGIPVTVGQHAALAEALQWIDIGDRRQVFHACRALLVSRREDLALFTLLFERFFQVRGDASRMPRPPRKRRGNRERALALADFIARRAGDDAPAIDIDDRQGAWSAAEQLRRRDFADLSDDELRRVRRMIAGLRFQVAERTTRRRRPHLRGEAVDLRKTLALVAQRGALPARLPERRRTIKPRPLVLVADISGSMEKYARLVLLLFYCMTRGAGQGAAVESFVFATRLTRITPALRLRNVDRAVEDAAASVVDWSGGTRIGDCLAAFNRRWARRVLRRGAVVILVSDGCDRGEPEVLGSAMAHLSRRAHRLVWLNPLLGDPRYQPLTRGMQAALPFVDDFLPVHSLRSLEQLASHLRALPARRTGRRAAFANVPPGVRSA